MPQSGRRYSISMYSIKSEMIVVRKKLLSLGIIVLLLFVFGCCKFFTRNRNDAKLQAVLSILKTIHLYEGSSEVNTYASSKELFANAGKTYKCKVTYEELKNFYLKRLQTLGWTLFRERKLTDWGQDEGGHELTFRKGDYSVVIEYAGEKANARWDYGVTVRWDN